MYTVQASKETVESDSEADAVVELYSVHNTLTFLCLQCKLVLETSESDSVADAVVELYKTTSCPLQKDTSLPHKQD